MNAMQLLGLLVESPNLVTSLYARHAPLAVSSLFIQWLEFRISDWELYGAIREVLILKMALRFGDLCRFHMIDLGFELG